MRSAIGFLLLLSGQARAFSTGTSRINLFSNLSAQYRPRNFFSKMSSTNNEVDLSAAAASSDPALNPSAPTFFDKITSKEIPANVIYEDEMVILHIYIFFTIVFICNKA